MFKIEGFIEGKHIFFNLKTPSKRGVLKEMVNKICEVDGLQEQEEELANHILNREKIESTGIGDGIAIPHCHYDGFPNRVKVYVGFPKTPMEFKSVDGSLVRIIFMIISDNQSNDIYLKTLSRLMYLLRSNELRDELYNVTEVDRFMEIIHRTDEQENYISYEGLKQLMDLLELENQIETYSKETLIEKGKRQGKADLKEDERYHQFQANRDDLAEAIDHRLMNIYRQLRSKYDKDIFAKVNKDTCSHCHMQVPIHIMREINRQNQIIQCSTCAKILTRVAR